MADKRIEDIAEDIAEIKTSIAEIKVDVRHHIRRTDQLEDRVLTLNVTKERLLGAVGFIGFLATILAIARVLN